MYQLTPSGLRGMTQLGAELREMGRGARSMEEVANRVVWHLYENVVDASQQPACVLVRFFKTHPFGELDRSLQQFAANLLGGKPASPTMQCLVLLATAGMRPEWNDRRLSQGHQAIPLPDEHAVASIPMIARLIRQFGVDVAAVVNPDPALLVDTGLTTFNVFHVPDAVGSPYVPAQQEFVVPCGVRSVLGFGGSFPSGGLFAVILFSRVPIDRATAEQFKTIALAVKLAVVPFEDRVFAE